MRFPAKKNAGYPKAPCDFPPRKDGILCPRRVVLGLPSPSHRVCGRTDVRMYGCTEVRMYGRTDGRSRDYYITTKFLGLIGYQISLAVELCWRALPANSAKRAWNVTSSSFWCLWHSHETCMKMNMFFAYSLAKISAPPSTDLFHFALENSVQESTFSKKKANSMRWRLLFLRLKILFVYCQPNLENLSWSQWLAASIRLSLCLCF